LQWLSSDGRLERVYKPVSDIVLDVARAADPAKSLVAMEKLSLFGPTQSDAGAAFSDVLGTTELDGAVNAKRANPYTEVALISGNSAAVASPIDARAKAYKGLEQLVLQNLVENMLPKDSADVFGRGPAGDIWRSMLAEQLAKQIGKTINLGLVKASGSMHSSKASDPLLEHHS
jgi:flagellar protein FlgJ